MTYCPSGEVSAKDLLTFSAVCAQKHAKLQMEFLQTKKHTFMSCFIEPVDFCMKRCKSLRCDLFKRGSMNIFE